MTSRTKCILIVVLILLLLVGIIFLIWYLNRPAPKQQSRKVVTPVSATQAPIQRVAPVTKRTAPARFLPKSRTSQIQVLDQQFFTIGYDNQRKNPAWVVS